MPELGVAPATRSDRRAPTERLRTRLAALSAASHAIAGARDLDVWAESEGPGRGSTFSFTVPRAASDGRAEGGPAG